MFSDLFTMLLALVPFFRWNPIYWLTFCVPSVFPICWLHFVLRYDFLTPSHWNSAAMNQKRGAPVNIKIHGSSATWRVRFEASPNASEHWLALSPPSESATHKRFLWGDHSINEVTTLEFSVVFFLQVIHPDNHRCGYGLEEIYQLLIFPLMVITFYGISI